jgi:hypothetical protein
VKSESTSTFETIESAQEYLGLLAQALSESQGLIDKDIRAQAASASPRRLDALRLIAYNLERLKGHMTRSQRILNDLRTLRRLLHRERPQIAA